MHAVHRARRRKRLWTEDDDRRLAEMIEAGKPYTLISATLRRSLLAVRARASSLGLKKPAAKDRK
jgi:hypothetical protein